MFRYVDYLQSKDSCRILKQGLGDWYDWKKAVQASQRYPMLVATAGNIQWVKRHRRLQQWRGSAEASRYAPSILLKSCRLSKEFLHVEKAASSEIFFGCCQKDAVEKNMLHSGDQASSTFNLVLGMVKIQYVT